MMHPLPPRTNLAFSLIVSVGVGDDDPALVVDAHSNSMICIRRSALLFCFIEEASRIVLCGVKGRLITAEACR